MQKWFYNGTYMQDGKPIAIAAYSEAEAEEFSKRGFRPVEEGAASMLAQVKAKVRKKAVDGRTEYAGKKCGGKGY